MSAPSMINEQGSIRALTSADTIELATVAKASLKDRFHGSLACVLLSAVLIPSAVRAAPTFSPTVDLTSHVDIRMETWLESVPNGGFVPVTLRIRNGDTQPHTWEFTSNSGGYGAVGGVSASARLTVEPGQTSER